ncbi:MAG TPA: ATP-dependent DNA helicase [Terriglobales bacterium]|nr:ATP-dependent DNA helicase [Terriglobales bacterium]
MPASFIPNPKQRKAIEHVHGPMLVLAGAGTGKTSVLVERIARLIENGHAEPEEILAVTFTENAAAELVERVEKRLQRESTIWAGTFHAYCYGLLKRMRSDFFTLVPEDVYVFLRQRIEQLGLKHFIKPSDLGQFLEDLRNFFDRCNEELIGPEQFQKYVDSLVPGSSLIPRNCRSNDVDQLGEAVILERWREIARVYSNSMRLLVENNVGTFSMQISKAVGLLQRNPVLLEAEQRRTKFILIDEFQDCNSSNIILAELLAGKNKNIFAVGDPDQAIYRFRGASSAAFEEFQSRFPETAAATLDENQRSRGNILRVAYAVIRSNPEVRALGRKAQFERRELQSARDHREQEQGKLIFDEPVEAAISDTDAQEAADIANEIQALRAGQGKGPVLSLAVLYRQHNHREKIVAELAARGIPFIVRGISVLETGPGRDLLAAVRAVVDPRDSESLFRVAAFPKFSIEPLELREKLAAARGDRPFTEILSTIEKGERLLEEIARIRQSVASCPGAAGVVVGVVREFGFDPADPVVKAFQRFVNAWEEKPFEQNKSGQAFLQYLDYLQQVRGAVPLWSDPELDQIEREHPEAVRLMTAHTAKGLEFDRVWILRAVSMAFPTTYRETLFEFPPQLRSSIATGDSKEVHEQEERRLFYVAITRARDGLAIHTRAGKSKHRTPTGFLRPLLEDRSLGSALEKHFLSDLPRQYGRVAAKSAVAGWLLLPPSFKGESVILSANAVESYSTCPMKFKLQQDWQVPGEIAAALQFGNAIHTVLRSYYSPKGGSEPMSADDVIAAFKAKFDTVAVEDSTQRKLYVERGVQQLRAMLDSQPCGSVEVIDAEVGFKFSLNGREVRGRIDRLDRIDGDRVRVVDYKTGAPKTQDFADGSLQLSIYSMAAAKMGFDPAELVFINLQDNESVVTQRTPVQLERAERKIQDAADGMAAGRFDPKPGPHCRWCDYARLCPATEQQVHVPTNGQHAAKTSR